MSLITRGNFCADSDDVESPPGGSADFEKRLLLQGVEPESGTPQGMHDKIKSESARWRDVIKDAGISVDSAL